MSYHQKVKAKKFLGQHFLKDEEIAEKIAHSLTHKHTYKVLEIGPGMGVLTKYLIEQKDIELKVVEIDWDSVAYLNQHYPTLKVIEGDFLQLPLQTLFNEPFAVIGNFPYNISSQIFFKVIENKELVPEMAGMFQREVALRIASPPGSKDYGILSVIAQAYYDIDYLFTVSEHVFDPPPKVKSAVIRMTRKDNYTLPCDEKLFKHVVKTAFNQRRKTLRNSTKSLGFKPEHLTDPIFTKRPEQLGYLDFIMLTQWLQA